MIKALLLTLVMTLSGCGVLLDVVFDSPKKCEHTHDCHDCRD